MEDYRSTTSLATFIESFTENYLYMLSRFYSFNCGKAMRHKFTSIKACIQESGLTLIPNLNQANLLDYRNFKISIKNKLRDFSNEIFIFIQKSLRRDEKYFMIYSSDEGYKEISPNREDFLRAICNYFLVNILIYEDSPNFKQFDIDNSDKICVSLDYSRGVFKARHRADEDSMNEAQLQAMPYFFSIKASPKNIPLVESEAKKVLSNFLKILVDAADTLKNYMSDNERNEIAEVLMFDDVHSVKRNKLLNVKVCDHEGNFGVFSCHHYHCYACLAEEIRSGINYTELKCLCGNPISPVDAEAATKISIDG